MHQWDPKPKLRKMRYASFRLCAYPMCSEGGRMSGWYEAEACRQASEGHNKDKQGSDDTHPGMGCHPHLAYPCHAFCLAGNMFRVHVNPIKVLIIHGSEAKELAQTLHGLCPVFADVSGDACIYWFSANGLRIYWFTAPPPDAPCLWRHCLVRAANAPCARPAPRRRSPEQTHDAIKLDLLFLGILVVSRGRRPCLRVEARTGRRV